MRMVGLWKNLESLNNQLKEVTGNTDCFSHQYTHLSILICHEVLLFTKKKKLYVPVFLLIFSIPGRRDVAFVATMTPMTECFGPFNKNVPISYSNVSLNQGYGYNPALGEHPFKEKEKPPKPTHKNIQKSSLA